MGETVYTVNYPVFWVKNKSEFAVLSLMSVDPDRWTYAALAAAVGCGPELIAKIIQGR